MVMTVGHRGAAGLLPENTLKGFQHAIALGVDMVECDVHLTRDGQVVVIHDATVNRTTNGRGAVRDLPLARLRALDAGEGEPVPTLDEVLALVRGRVHLLCELKGVGVEAAAVAKVAAQGMADAVTFSSFELARLANVRAMGSQYQLAAILPNPTEFDLARAAALGVTTVDICYTHLSYQLLAAAHQQGLSVCAWNPDTWAEQYAMLLLGADRISSNRPDLLLAGLQSLAAQGELAEAETQG